MTPKSKNAVVIQKQVLLFICVLPFNKKIKSDDQPCKPGSVQLSLRRSSIWTIRCRMPQATCRGCAGQTRYPFGVASDRVYREPWSPIAPVSSYLAFPPLPTCVGGISLLHFPWSRLRRPLAVILPCEARTFLEANPERNSLCDRPFCSSLYFFEKHMNRYALVSAT